MTLFRRRWLTAVLGALFAVAPGGPAHAEALRFHRSYRLPSLSGPYGIVVSPDGRHLYVSAEDENVIDVFVRDAISGALELAGAVHGETNDFNPRGLAVSPDGRHLYVAGHDDGILGIFARDSTTGLLAPVGHEDDTPGPENALDGAEAVVVSGDGAHVYVASRSAGAVVAFGRDRATGLLTFLEREYDARDGVEGLEGARDLALSPDGAHLYVAGGGENAVAVFRRDPGSGGLTFVAVLRDGQGGVDGLDKAQSVAVTPDGRHVLVAGTGEDKLAVFRRDPSTGLLTPFELYEDESGGVDGLNGAYAIAVSPDGRRVYVTGSVDDAIVLFARDPASGALRYLEHQKNQASSGRLLTHPRGVTPSPDDMHVYVAVHGDDAVTAFLLPRCGDGRIDLDEACDDGNRDEGDCCSADCRTPAAADTPCADDANPCTADVCDGTSRGCVHVPGPPAPCDDGAFCTVDDTCRKGSCTGTPRACPGPGDCSVGVCDESAKACLVQAAPDDRACNDGDACSTADRCVAGLCVGRPVACPADDCHDAGTCNPTTGACVSPARPDGNPCDDGDARTAPDVCTAGACRGVPLPDADRDGVLDILDVCPRVPDADQLDLDHDGVGEACTCTSPGRCLPGGGPVGSDCLLEFNPTGSPARNGRTLLRCTDGDPSCDRDAVAGRCTVGVAICLANTDPQLAGCPPGDVRSFEILRPGANDRALLDHVNAQAVERSVAAMGLEVRRQGRVVAAASASLTGARCGPLVELLVPARARPGRPARRRFRMRAVGGDGRIDTDVLTIECRR